MRIYKNILELVGHTPLLELSRFSKEYGLKTPLLAKLEAFNPAGSVKDRIAKNMILQAEKEGYLKKGSVIIEPTSGNTGIGLACAAAASAYGAELVLTDGSRGMKGAIEKAAELAESTKNAFVPSQFTNAYNPAAHEESTGPEIWEDTEGRVDLFVAGVGTGGTITGTGRYLKAQNPDIRIVAVEPSDSPVLSGGAPGPHKIQGIGAGFVPDVLNEEIYDEVLPVSLSDAFSAARALAHTEGFLAGISSGAALHAAAQLGKRKENKEKQIVVLLPDTGERYLTTDLFK